MKLQLCGESSWPCPCPRHLARSHPSVAAGIRQLTNPRTPLAPHPERAQSDSLDDGDEIVNKNAYIMSTPTHTYTYMYRELMCMCVCAGGALSVERPLPT